MANEAAMANKARPKKVVERFEDEVTQRSGTLCCQRRMFDMLPREKFQIGDRVEVTVKLLKRKA